MYKIVIVASHKNIDKCWRFWLEQEEDINFKHDIDKACRCTISYAIYELKTHLAQFIESANISIASVGREGAINIELEIVEPENPYGGFTLIPHRNGLTIRGLGRHGLLNGVYRFLKNQGCRWIEPGEYGLVLPPLKKALKLPTEEVQETPAFKYRSLDIYLGISKESRNLLIWMARNGLNCFHTRSLTGKLGQKLGLTVRAGGHVVQHLLEPTRILSSGKSLWDEHPEWYGRHSSGERSIAIARRMQCCVSQPSLFDFLMEELLLLVNGKWKEADVIDFWGFDNALSEGCNCSGCKSIGNTSDQTLLFLSEMRKRIDSARSSDKLNRNIYLTVTAYDGNNTITPPIKPLPDNLKNSGDICIFYPIDRCYKHDFINRQCEDNKHYNTPFVEWVKNNPGLNVWSGEYYGVSKFEDLPFVCTRRMGADIPFYFKTGAVGITYMHPPAANWGMRSLTQCLYAELAWNTKIDVNAFIKDYLKNRYGQYADAIAEAYRELETAWEYISQWRNWHGNNVLRNFLEWDGKKPDSKMNIRHFLTPEVAILSGKKSVVRLENALDIVSKALTRSRLDSAEVVKPLDYLPENPGEEVQLKLYDIYEYRLGEDKRSLIYSVDMMKIMVFLLNFYLQLADHKNDEAAVTWSQIEELAERMDSYYFPMKFLQPGPGVECLDALTRSQLRRTMALCRKNFHQHKQ